jgi:hypothetical protein
MIALWTLAACWGWTLSLSVGLRLLIYAQQKNHWKPLPEWSAPLIFVGLFGVGTILFAISILILGMRGRLPGTSRQARKPQGFPMMPASSSD